MISNKKISIIMLIYNTGKDLLDKSIGSLLHQTYKNLEIILLDDCSTKEETIQTLKYYEDNYENVRIVKHEANHGMLRGRITGFKNSTGNYIAYLDSDDTASVDYYRTLLETAENNDADMVVSTFNLENEDGEIYYYTRCHFRNKIYDLKNEEIFKEYIHQQGKNCAWSLVWNKLYRRDLLERAVDDIEAFSMSHNGLNMTEDIAFTCPVFIQAKHMVSCQGEGVKYYQHSGQSINVSQDKNKWLRSVENVVSVFRFIDNLLKNNDLQQKCEKDFFFWRAYYLYLNSKWRPKSISYEEAYNKLSNMYWVENSRNFHEEIEDYFYRDIGYITSDEKYKDDIVSQIISAQTKVVSFDIFDTLIMRDLFEPKDVFGYLDIEFNKLNNKSYVMFHRIRAEAEANVRQVVKKEEVTFDEIYDYIEKNYSISHDLCEKMKKKELELEHKFMVPRKFGRKLYDIARLNGKKVIFTSDMYLSKKDILSLLEKCGYTDEDVKIYLSCEINKTKQSGSLYRHVLKEENIKPEEMVHIGDNYHADFESAKRAGINAYYVIRTTDKFFGTIYGTLFEKNLQFIEPFDMYERLLTRSMFGLVKNRLFDNPYIGFDPNTIVNGQPGFLGYFAVGMELVSLMHWIEGKVRNSKKVHFVARDGYLPMLAYQELKKYNKKLPEENYFYISRKALLLLDVKSQEDLVTLDVKMNVLNLSLKKIAESFNSEFVNFDLLKIKAKENKISYDKKFEEREEFYAAIKLLDNSVVDYKKHTKHCGKIVDNFKKEITPNNKFFDIGYSGRAESIISDVLGYPVDSLYVHTNADAPAIRSKISNFKIDCFLKYTPKVRGHIREHIFMKNAPSLIKYELVDGKIKHVFEESKILSTTEAVTTIVQEKAIEYVKDFYKYFYEYMDWLSFPEQYAIFPYERYINAPTEKDKQIFSCVVFEDDMGVGQDKNLMEIWNTNMPESVRYVPGIAAAMKIANVLNRFFPVGTRRRKFAKKIYKGLKKVYRFFRPIKSTVK